jgi:hypothetical protein
MIEVIMTIRTKVTEDTYKDSVEEAVNDIKSRKFQRELMGQKGVLNVTATVQVIKPKNK